MKPLIIAMAALGLTASAALADCAYHQKSAQSDKSQSEQSRTETPS
jgi:hypothetical protein